MDQSDYSTRKWPEHVAHVYKGASREPVHVPFLTALVDRQSPEWWPSERPGKQLHRWEWVKGPGREFFKLMQLVGSLLHLTTLRFILLRELEGAHRKPGKRQTCLLLIPELKKSSAGKGTQPTGIVRRLGDTR